MDRSTRVPSSPSRQPRAVSSSNERRARRHARDFSHTSITIYTGDVSSSGRSTPWGPDTNKDLPRIPSTSTELWSTEPITVSSEVAASPATSPALNHPPLPVSEGLKRTAPTEAQRIAARYRRRYGSLEALRSEVLCPPKLEVSPFLMSDTFIVSPTDAVDDFSTLRK